ncbi:MAG: hypothetical protein A2Y56_11855 [Candidatus Aminicenantes bacterium RBG_13_63_10]|nr:MAG: hypothetical protein A2Y56_11855 [Candidatus Aminicenantes bacterium RBG_13_63_10]
MSYVVVNFADGEERTGKAAFFNIQKATFPLEVETAEGRTEVRTVRLEEVKKIVFLKKEPVAASAVHYETISQSTFASTVAFKLVVEFQDGELMTGSAMKYSPEDKGFFLIPLNPADPSERTYINSSSIKKVDKKRLLGKLLIDDQRISESQLKEALDIQAEQRGKKIGSIMVDETMISRKQLDESLHRQKEKNIKLGELLVEAGYITREQLEKALALQKEYRQKRLGQILVELKYLTPNDICLALASQLGFAWVDLNQTVIPDEIINLLPAEAIKKYEVIPVEIKGKDILVVASSQPQDPDLKKDLRSLADFPLEFVVAFDGYISALIRKHFPDSS